MQYANIAVIGPECVACGVCANNCPLSAIIIHKGCNALVNIEKCVGCKRCAKTCPAAVISIIERENVIQNKPKDLVDIDTEKSLQFERGGS